MDRKTKEELAPDATSASFLGCIFRSARMAKGSSGVVRPADMSDYSELVQLGPLE